MSLEYPSGFVFTHAVLQVKHRVARFGVGIVIGRCVHKAAAPLPCDRRVIDPDAHIAVWHIVGKVVVNAVFGNFDSTGIL